MSARLTLHAAGHKGDGPDIGSMVVYYLVDGLPANEEIAIANLRRQRWQILRIKARQQYPWTGSFDSPEAALASLQNEFDAA